MVLFMKENTLGYIIVNLGHGCIKNLSESY